MEENQDQGLRIASEPDPETEGEAAAERVSAVFKKALESAPLAAIVTDRMLDAQA
jgi:hypothetical protein